MVERRSFVRKSSGPLRKYKEFIVQKEFAVVKGQDKATALAKPERRGYKG